MIEVTWSDPAVTDGETGFTDNTERGCACVFGSDRVEQFRKRNSLDLIIRSHEPVGSGFEWFDSGHLVTVFSATNYTGYCCVTLLVPVSFCLLQWFLPVDLAATLVPSSSLITFSRCRKVVMLDTLECRRIS
jgi:hypothetical protein